LWERLVLVEMVKRFVEHPDPNKPNERPRDPLLKERLAEESTGILAWLVRGFMAYQEHGLKKPQKVTTATDEYRADEDVFEKFLADCCFLSPDAKGEPTPLWDAFQAWGGGLSRRAFRDRLKKRFGEQQRSNSKRFHVGVGLLSPKTDQESS
jgi:putative DNA primase/helicase